MTPLFANLLFHAAVFTACAYFEGHFRCSVEMFEPLHVVTTTAVDSFSLTALNEIRPQPIFEISLLKQLSSPPRWPYLHPKVKKFRAICALGTTKQFKTCLWGLQWNSAPELHKPA
mmetsp:Transcript_74903/g.132292  ORF Transcript_74903/g.132292 Transcript_74903/m.132292 type:complete len:116 (-) Transcript_74903:112-459(-)